MPNDPFYYSAPWRELRAKALRNAGGVCQWCHRSVRRPGAARVDHIQTRRDFPALALVLSNLRVLCVDCDGKRHADKGGRVHDGADANGWPSSPGHHWNKKSGE
jgi:5-methylcytosine-specific restriction endonuclease McrA